MAKQPVIRSPFWALPAIDGVRYSKPPSALVAPTISVTSFTSSSVTVGITGQANNTTLVPQIRVADTGEYESRTGIAADASTYTYTGLDPETEYDVRMQVGNGVTTANSNVVTSETSEEGALVGHGLTVSHYTAPYAEISGATSDAQDLGSTAWSAATSSGAPVTLGTAMARAVAGNVVQVAPGSYMGPDRDDVWHASWCPSENGSSGNPITFVAQYPAATNLTEPTSHTRLRSPNIDRAIYGSRGYAGGATSAHIVWDGFYTNELTPPDTGQDRRQAIVGGGVVGIAIRRGLFERLGNYPGGSNTSAIFHQSCADSSIHDCVFRGGANLSGGGSHNNAAIITYDSNNFSILNCLFEPHEDAAIDCGIFVKAHRGTSDGNAGEIRLCRFVDCRVDGIHANEMDNSRGGVDVVQNLFEGCGFMFDWSSDVSGKNTRLHNNTIIGRANSENNTIAIFPSSFTNQVSVKDNILVMVSGQTYGIYAHNTGANPDDAAVWDWNCYYRASGSFVFRYNNTTYTGLSAWQAARTVDDNSIEANPLFVGGGDYRLQSGSPALTASSTSPSGPVGCYITGSEEIGVRANPSY